MRSSKDRDLDMSGHILFIFIIVVFLAILNRRWSLFLGLVLLLWFFSFRTNDIPDTEVYEWMYNDPISRMDYNELGFLLLGYLFKAVTGAGFMTYYLFLIGSCFLLLFFASRRLLQGEEHFGMLLLIFLSFYGFFYMGVTIRNCISEVLVLCGISLYLTTERKWRLFLFLLFVGMASVIHKSSLFFLLLLPLWIVKIPDNAYNRIFMTCIIVWLISGTGIAREIVGRISEISMFSNYEKFSTSSEASPNLFSLQVLISLMVSFYAIRYKNLINPDYQTTYNFFLKINILGLMVLSIIWSLPTSYRFYNMFFFYNFILIYLMIFHNDGIELIKDKMAISLSVCVAYYAILIHSFSFMLMF